jgi:hypothetical protein
MTTRQWGAAKDFLVNAALMQRDWILRAAAAIRTIRLK